MDITAAEQTRIRLHNLITNIAPYNYTLRSYHIAAIAACVRTLRFHYGLEVDVPVEIEAELILEGYL